MYEPELRLRLRLRLRPILAGRRVGGGGINKDESADTFQIAWDSRGSLDIVLDRTSDPRKVMARAGTERERRRAQRFRLAVCRPPVVPRDPLKPFERHQSCDGSVFPPRMCSRGICTVDLSSE